MKTSHGGYNKVGDFNLELFKINDIYKLNESNIEERILWIDENYRYCYTIRLNVEKLLVQAREIAYLNTEFENERLIFIPQLEESNYLKSLNMSESTIKNLEFCWKIIKMIAMKDNEPEIFDVKARSKYVKKAVDELGTSKATVYKCIRKFWQGGKIKVALMCNLYKCGGKGKEKKLGSAKVGRRSYISFVDPDKIGINVTDDTKDKFRHYVKKYFRNHREISLKQTYKIMLAEEFTSRYQSEDGEQIINALPPEQCPTYDQFRYWYYKGRNIKEEIEDRKSEKDYKLNHAPINSNAKYHAFGPGYIFEIDSTIYPIYLLNRIKGDNIGRPVIYHVSDVFTTQIVGIYIGMGNACYEGAMSALYNCTENKVEFCKRYDVEITEEDWSTTGLPNSLRADRGELAAALPEKIISNLGITKEITPSFMGKMKGTVENSFFNEQHNLKPYLSGVIESDFRKRGGTDARKDAKMNILEFTRCVIRAVILFNKRIMGKYPLTQGMLDDDIKPTPVDIWRWGIKNISGILRTVPDTYLKLNLLRSGTAKVTKRGIEFIGRAFECDIGKVEDWYSKARNIGYWKVNIRYNPENMNKIYIIDEDGNRFITCYLKKEEVTYFNRTYDEIVKYNTLKNIELQRLKGYENNNYLEFHRDVKKEVRNANKNARVFNKRVLTEEIKRNRKVENDLYGKGRSINFEDENIENKKVTTNDRSNNYKKIIFDKITKIKREGNKFDK